jgi:hypothetical protein
MRATRKLPPETDAQVRDWTKLNNAYKRLGIGTACAAQGAWQAQQGAGPARPPCELCAPLVAKLPGPERNGWRSP